jgi:hypothetical protein
MCEALGLAVFAGCIVESTQKIVHYPRLAIAVLVTFFV